MSEHLAIMPTEIKRYFYLLIFINFSGYKPTFSYFCNYFPARRITSLHVVNATDKNVKKKD